MFVDVSKEELDREVELEAMIKYSRKDFMTGVCDFETYYGQMVTKRIVEAVVSIIGADRILKSKDDHLNDIPLKEWDRVGYSIGIQCHWPAGDSCSMAGLVCVAKNAARKFQINNQRSER